LTLDCNQLIIKKLPDSQNIVISFIAVEQALLFLLYGTCTPLLVG